MSKYISTPLVFILRLINKKYIPLSTSGVDGQQCETLVYSEGPHLPPMLMAAFPAVSQISGAPSPPLTARINLGIVKKVEIPAAAERAR